MSMDPPKNISSDDAAIFAANVPSDAGDDGSDTEDPVGRTASKLGQLDNFHGYQPAPPKKGKVLPGTGEPKAFGFQMTPGAKKCAVVRGADRQPGTGRKFA